jgi:RNA polymerase sigma-70 factor (ECF subfamily)
MTSLEAAERMRLRHQKASQAAHGPPDFDAVYREHFRFVWRMAKRLGVAPAFLDDVVQEVFLVVHRRLPDFEGHSMVKTWLYGIVRRVGADHRRALRRKPTAGAAACAAGERIVEAEEAERSPPAGTAPDAEARVERAEQVRLLQRLLDGLDEDKREVFVLAELEEMTVAQIAEALGENANTISSRLRAARRDFEEALERATREEALERATRSAPSDGISDRRQR